MSDSNVSDGIEEQFPPTTKLTDSRWELSTSWYKIDYFIFNRSLIIINQNKSWNRKLII
jgi:hypothetical protein